MCNERAEYVVGEDATEGELVFVARGNAFVRFGDDGSVL